MVDVDKLGIIAGNRSLPILLAQQARELGVHRLVAVAINGETDPRINDYVDDVTWLKVGQLSKLIKAFKSANVKKCVMVGQISPKNLFDLRPDLRTMKLMMRLKKKNAHTIFGAIADELEAEGIKLVEATPWLKPIMPDAGYHVGPKLSTKQKSDIKLGHRIATEIARLDIGQTVVIKNGTVLAVEGFEGTDACLSRGGELAGSKGGAVAIKVAKPDHDFRFDIPCLGRQTLETCAAYRLSALAFQSSRTLLLDRKAVEEKAIQLKISVMTI